MSGTAEPMRRVATVTIVVADYDAAISWYTEKLGFTLFEDADLGGGKRWVTVGPSMGGVRLLLARAGGRAEQSRIGDQTGGRVFLFLETDDFARDHAAMQAAGVVFEEPPRHEPYGTVAIFADLHGNKWDLIQPTR